MNFEPQIPHGQASDHCNCLTFHGNILYLVNIKGMIGHIAGNLQPRLLYATLAGDGSPDNGSAHVMSCCTSSSQHGCCDAFVSQSAVSHPQHGVLPVQAPSRNHVPGPPTLPVSEAVYADPLSISWLQGDTEAQLGLSVTPFCDRRTVVVSATQLRFVDMFLRPLLPHLTWAIGGALSRQLEAGLAQTVEHWTEHRCEPGREAMLPYVLAVHAVGSTANDKCQL